MAFGADVVGWATARASGLQKPATIIPKYPLLGALSLTWTNLQQQIGSKTESSMEYSKRVKETKL